MESFGVAMDNLASFAAGLLAGLALSWAFGLVSDRFNPKAREGVMKTFRRSPAFAAVLVVISLVAFGLGVRVGYQVLNGKVECFDQYANDLADSLEPRNSANQELATADKARDEALVDLLEPGNDAADNQAFIEANDAKVEIQDKLAETRAKNPYPDPPREVCR